MPLLLLIALATIFYTLFEIFSSLAANKIDSNLSAVVFNGLGAIIPLATYVYFKYLKDRELISVSNEGIFHSVAAGISIALFSILLIKIFERGDLAYVIPLIYGGSIVLAALTGILIFKDNYNFTLLIGIFLITVGVGFVVYSKV